MPTALLDSQLDTLEPPGEDERAITLGIGGSAAEQADEIARRLGLRTAGVTS
jgi:gluconokinase